MRFFNTAGPVKEDIHYCLDPLQRLDLDDLLLLIAQQKYFVLHAPRQTGKTSTLLALERYLNAAAAAADYYCVYVNVEIGQSAREDVGAAMQAILSQLASSARITLHDKFLNQHWKAILADNGPHAALSETLKQWSAYLARILHKLCAPLLVS